MNIMCLRMQFMWAPQIADGVLWSSQSARDVASIDESAHVLWPWVGIDVAVRQRLAQPASTLERTCPAVANIDVVWLSCKQIVITRNGCLLASQERKALGPT